MWRIHKDIGRLIESTTPDWKIRGIPAQVHEDFTNEKSVDYYKLRFQIEFNFRDVKQYWGQEDFLNVKEVHVTNAANLAFFMVNVSQALIQNVQKDDPHFSIQDLKAYFRGSKYVNETLKLLPQKPDQILIQQIFTTRK